MAKARTSDGFQLYYETHGSGPPIVLVHELGGSHASFHFQVDAWSPRFTCIAYNATPEALAAKQKAEIARWTPIIKEAASRRSDTRHASADKQSKSV